MPQCVREREASGPVACLPVSSHPSRLTTERIGLITNDSESNESASRAALAQKSNPPRRRSTNIKATRRNSRLPNDKSITSKRKKTFVNLRTVSTIHSGSQIDTQKTHTIEFNSRTCDSRELGGERGRCGSKRVHVSCDVGLEDLGVGTRG